MNVIINIEDNLFQDGLMILFKQLFGKTFPQGISFVNEISNDTIATADVIVMNFLAGESYLCHRVLYSRKSNSLVIGFYDGVNNPHHKKLPICMANSIFINRSDSIDNVKMKIFNGWMHCNKEMLKINLKSCLKCKHKTLSDKQNEVISRICNGETVASIATSLDINGKTVTAHKNLIKNKFKMNNDRELLALICYVKKNKATLGLYPFGDA